MANESFLACDFAVCTFPPCSLLPSLLSLCLCCCRCLKWTAFCFLLVFLVCCQFRRTFCKPYISCSFFLLIILILLRICCFIYVLQPYRSLCFFCGLTLRMLNIYKKLQARAHWIKSGSWCQVPAQRKLSGTSSTAQHTHTHAGTPKGICSLWRWAAPTNQIRVAQLCEPLLLFTVSEKFTLLASCRHVAFQFSSAYEQ